MITKLTRLLKESALYSVNAVALPLIGIILVPIYTRIFSPDEYGIIELITTVTALLTILLIAGLENGIGRYYIDIGSPDDKRKIATTGIAYLALTALIVITVLMVFSNNLSSILFQSGDYSQVLLVALACIPFMVMVSSFANLLRFRLQPLRAVVLALGTLLLQTALIIIFVVTLNKGIIGIYIATLITQLVFTLVGFILTYDSYAPGFSVTRLKQILYFGMPYLLLSFCYFIMTNSDRYFLNYFQGLGEVGIYGIGYKMASVIGIAVMGFQFAWGPFIYSTYKDADAKRTFARVFDYVSVAACILVLALSLFSVELLHIFATAQYFEAYKVVPFICAGLVIYTLGGYFSVGVGIAKKTIHVAWTGMVAALVNLLLNWLLIPRFGMQGAAVSAVISFLILAVLLMIISQRLYKVPYRFSTNVIMYFVTAAIIAVAYLFIMNDITWINVGIKVLLLLLFLAVPFILKLLGIAEVKYLYALMTRAVRK